MKYSQRFGCQLVTKTWQFKPIIITFSFLAYSDYYKPQTLRRKQKIHRANLKKYNPGRPILGHIFGPCLLQNYKTQIFCREKDGYVTSS